MKYSSAYHFDVSVKEDIGRLHSRLPSLGSEVIFRLDHCVKEPMIVHDAFIETV